MLRLVPARLMNTQHTFFRSIKKKKKCGDHFQQPDIRNSVNQAKQSVTERASRSSTASSMHQAILNN